MLEYALVITSPVDLASALGEAAQLALGAGGCAPGEVRRLGPEALDIPFDRDPRGAVLLAEAALRGATVDVNIAPARGRRKQLLIADMDSTIIPVECIDEAADFAGVRDRVADITERAMRGELDFEGALRERVGFLRGLPVSALARVYAERISLNPGAAVLARTMNAHGAMTALVSGGFTYFAERVGAAAGFQHTQANVLLIEGDALNGKVGEPILGRGAKLEALLRLCAELGIGPEQTIAVGDGANDLAMVEAAGLGVAYRAKPTLAEKADVRIRVSDLTALLYLQGYRRDEFASAD